MKALGTVVIIAGIVLMIFGSGIFTKKEKIIDLGPIEVNKIEKQQQGWPLYAGAVITIAGAVVLLVAGKRK